MPRITAQLINDLSVREVEELFSSRSDIDQGVFCHLESDTRAGVRRIAARLRRSEQRSASEEARVKRMMIFENDLWESGVRVVAGVDEVGRGCLAGPVVAAAVAFKPGSGIQGINDSKKLNPELREKLSQIILDQALSATVAKVEAPEIDRLNILQASLLAMRKAIGDLVPDPEHVLIDGSVKAGSPFSETAVVRGDERSISIAAASIVAKVHRDRLMVELDKTYPHYGFVSNKGYASKHHRQALCDYGPCRLHRRSFEPVAAHFRSIQ